MKKLVVEPALSLRGTLEIPGDKSISHRAIMMGSLAHGTTTVEHFLPSDDCLSTIQIFREMGVQIEQKGDRAVIHEKGSTPSNLPRKSSMPEIPEQPPELYWAFW